MASLKDIRLWLIVALAVLCLIAVRNCATSYQSEKQTTTAALTDALSTQSAVENKGIEQPELKQPDTTEDSGNPVIPETEANKLLSQTDQIDNISSVPAEESVESAGVAGVKVVVDSTLAETDKTTEPAADNDKPASSSSPGYNSSVESDDNSAAAVTNAVGPANSVTVDDEGSGATITSETTTSETGTLQTITSETITSATAISTSNDAGAVNQGVSVEVVQKERVFFSLGELSGTGELPTDLNNDITTTRKDLENYQGRISALKETIEKLRSEM